MIDGPSGVGREFTAAGFNARLRDYDRIGLLMLNEGRAIESRFFLKIM